MTDAVTIFANPFSGARGNRHRVETLAAELRCAGLIPEMIWDRADRCGQLADQGWRARCRCIVAAGGDGTVGTVINACAASFHDAPLAILPLGNENLLAKELGFMVSPRQLAAAIVRRQTRDLDLGFAAGKRFTLMLSAGFDATVVHELHRWRAGHTNLRRVRHLSYLQPIFTALRHYQFRPITLHADDQAITGTHALIFNLPRYALGLPFAPEARGDDGLLNWIVFERPGRLPLLADLLAVVCRRHCHRMGVQYGLARTISMSAGEAVPIQIDGDAAGYTPVTVECRPHALPIIVT